MRLACGIALAAFALVAAATKMDAPADAAFDTRIKTLESEEIRAYLVARYGDFVLYDPPLKRTTWLLWIGPFALLAGGGMLWWTVLRRRELAGRSTQRATDPDAEARGRALLDDSDEPPHTL